jgi:anti-sigma regulatory factor (Ser/Thr protein kinase)
MAEHDQAASPTEPPVDDDHRANRETAPPEAMLGRAVRDGDRLTLESVQELAPRLPLWLRGCPDLRDLDPDFLRLLESALYEACTNILEHGYRGAPEARVDLWWLAARATAPDRALRGGEAIRRRVRDGCFVLLDHGRPFDPTSHRRTDLSDTGVRRRGRGLGLEMIHRIMSEVSYRADTSKGNVTVLRFDPDRVQQATPEVPHG